MLAFAIGFLVTAGVPNTSKTTIICEVGSVAMRDLPNVNGNKRFDAYYAAPDPGGHDLLTACPKLKEDIPQGYPLADDDARSRATSHVPIPGRTVRAAFIYSVGIPKISSDHKSAIVHFSYSCTGLCGGELEARYVRTSTGWHRDGEIRILSVS